MAGRVRRLCGAREECLERMGISAPMKRLDVVRGVRVNDTKVQVFRIREGRSRPEGMGVGHSLP